MIADHTNFRYDGRTFYKLRLEPEDEDTSKELLEAVEAFLEETSATYFRVDFLLNGEEISAVIDGHFQVGCFLNALKMANAIENW